MRKLTAKQNELLEILKRGGVHSVSDIADELRIKPSSVRFMVRSLRQRFLHNSDSDVDFDYIYSTSGGYTTDEKPEHTVYESRMRLRLGFGVLFNGVYVFKKCKQIAHTNFESLNVEFKPKMLTVQKLIK